MSMVLFWSKVDMIFHLSICKLGIIQLNPIMFLNMTCLIWKKVFVWYIYLFWCIFTVLTLQCIDHYNILTSLCCMTHVRTNVLAWLRSFLQYLFRPSCLLGRSLIYASVWKYCVGFSENIKYLRCAQFGILWLFFLQD